MNREQAGAWRLLGGALFALTVMRLVRDGLHLWFLDRMTRSGGAFESYALFDNVSKVLGVGTLAASLLAFLAALGIERSGRARLAAFGLFIHLLVAGLFLCLALDLFSMVGATQIEAFARHAWKFNLAGMALAVVGLGATVTGQRVAARRPALDGPLRAAGVAWLLLFVEFILRIVAPEAMQSSGGLGLSVVYGVVNNLPWLLTGWVVLRHAKALGAGAEIRAGDADNGGWDDLYGPEQRRVASLALGGFASLMVARIALSVGGALVTVLGTVGEMPALARAVLIVVPVGSILLGAMMAHAAWRFGGTAVPGAARARAAAALLLVGLLVEIAVLVKVSDLMGDRYGPALRAAKTMPIFELAALVTGLGGALAMVGVCRAVARERADEGRLAASGRLVGLWIGVLVAGGAARLQLMGRRPNAGLLVVCSVIALVLAITAAVSFVGLLRRTAADLEGQG